MSGLEAISFKIALGCVGASVVMALVAAFAGRLRKAPTGKTVSGAARGPLWDYIAVGLIAAGLFGITAAIISRAVSTGHGPFSNMYEFSLAFVWGILAMTLFFLWRFRVQIIKMLGGITALALLIFADTLPSKPVPLVPALQQSFLLSAHVAAAVVAYGAFTMGFAASILYLVKKRSPDSGMPDLKLLDDMSYLSVKIGFPFMTLLIVLGALWANIAWGTYWSWDPKETASLVTWLLFASYLHARVIGGWRGQRTAMILIIGFGAVLFTFFGNYIFSGLHSYQ
jgi:ABC-type transport system involved in cytochrome c biogenesis permease subunit